MRPARHVLTASALALSIVGASQAAHAEDLFEIQVFHARVAPYQHFQLELHSNYAGDGATVTTPPEASTSGVLYEMLEPSYGFAPRWEVGAHLQQSLRPDGTVDWGGAKLRAMVLLTEPHSDVETTVFHFAINVEGGYQPARIDPARWGTEIRPVIDWTRAWFDVDVNPIIAFGWSGDHAGVPQLQPAASVRATIAETVAPGVEYYAQLGPLSDIPPVAEQRHYVFQTVDVVRWPEWIVHLGFGEGLTSASTRWIVTSILGHVF